MAAVSGKTKPSFVKRSGKFLREVRAEMRKVAWPNRKELTNQTIIVLVTVAIVALYIAGVDVVISTILDLLVRIGG